MSVYVVQPCGLQPRDELKGLHFLIHSSFLISNKKFIEDQ